MLSRISHLSLLVTALVWGAEIANAGTVTLAWNRTPEPDVAGYRVKYGTVKGNYNTVVNAGNAASLAIPNLQSRSTYYFVVTAYDGANLESPISNEVTYLVPPDSTVDTDGDGLPDDWENLYGLNASGNGTADDGANGDPDRDGICNFLEYAFDLNPTSSNTDGLPVPSLIRDESDGLWYFSLTVRRRTDAPQIEYQVERSTNCVSWSLANAGVIGNPVVNGDGTSETVIYRILPGFASLTNESIFGRVVAKINVPPPAPAE